MLRRAPLRSRSRLARRTPLKSRGLRPARVVDDAYLDWIRSLPCLIAGLDECIGKVQAHHLRREGRSRDNDRRSVPLCLGHHRLGSRAVHFIGRKAFEQRFGISLDCAVETLNCEYEHRRQAA